MTYNILWPLFIFSDSEAERLFLFSNFHSVLHFPDDIIHYLPTSSCSITIAISSIGIVTVIITGSSSVCSIILHFLLCAHVQ